MGLYSWLEKKEGGFWGVVVVFAAFMIQIPSFGTAQSFGIYNMYLLKHFKDSSPAAVALIGSINVGVFLGSGPIATFLMNHMSHRKVALLGAVLSSAGLIAMPFAPNLVYMYGFYGVLSGNKKKEAHIIKYQFICVCTLFSLCQQLITDKMHFIFFYVTQSKRS